MKIHWDETKQVFWAELDGRPRGGTSEERNTYWGQKDVVREAGFRFDGNGDMSGRRNTWATRFIEPAEKLAQYCVGVAAEKVGAVQEKRQASRTVDADIDVPAPEGEAYMPFQRGGISFMSQQPNTLLGDDMGLGKTIQFLGLVNLDTSIKNVLVVCPASVRINWTREAQKWLTRTFEIIRIKGNVKVVVTDQANFVITGWSNLGQKKTRESLMAIKWDAICFDEAHYAKNQRSAKRAQAALGKYEYVKGEGDVLKEEGLVHRAKRVVFATGTPIVNRPVELFPMLRVLDPEGLGKNFFGFAKRYCGAHHNGWSWDFNGATNLEELQDRMRGSCMIRRMKQQVLTELPAKRRQVVVIEPNGMSRLVRREQKLLDSIDGYREAVKAGDYEKAIRLLQASPAGFEEISRIRHEMGVAKTPKVVEHVKDALEGGVEKLIVFAHHRDVQDAIAEALSDYGVVQVKGGYSDVKKQEAVDAFQEDKSIRVFVGSLEACREGLNLTAASNVILAELPWTPSAVSQAEDRAHRHGQKNAVNVQHLVVEGGLEAYMAQTIVTKQDNIDAALDNETAKQTLVAPTLDREVVKSQELQQGTSLASKIAQVSNVNPAVQVTEADLDTPPF
jgi:SWI/SNF-related matrix-associated actin-dependent regulator 1 of chromatin subfamily A